ncbi:MAG: hypothetical protein HQL07_14985 [Nitrospirae bacterium]|nr:hypothetical protein [Magnetococcales bacterium]HAT49840.1 hypothetical protein [Alphaproteobacteria bacterium]
MSVIGTRRSLGKMFPLNLRYPLLPQGYRPGGHDLPRKRWKLAGSAEGFADHLSVKPRLSGGV